uniref:Uncharacterized protein n=1 Tax=Oryza nivara TaxID=4536 RepID=A0A0E0IWV7_ORYNI
MEGGMGAAVPGAASAVGVDGEECVRRRQSTPTENHRNIPRPTYRARRHLLLSSLPQPCRAVSSAARVVRAIPLTPTAAAAAAVDSDAPPSHALPPAPLPADRVTTSLQRPRPSPASASRRPRRESPSPSTPPRPTILRRLLYRCGQGVRLADLVRAAITPSTSLADPLHRRTARTPSLASPICDADESRTPASACCHRLRLERQEVQKPYSTTHPPSS